jgi:hypothetical protein
MWSTLDSNYEGEIAICSMFIRGLNYSVGLLYGLKQPFFFGQINAKFWPWLGLHNEPNK